MNPTTVFAGVNDRAAIRCPAVADGLDHFKMLFRYPIVETLKIFLSVCFIDELKGVPLSFEHIDKEELDTAIADAHCSDGPFAYVLRSCVKNPSRAQILCWDQVFNPQNTLSIQSG